MDDELFFTNVTYDPDVYYFLYIGELKCYDLNRFLAEMFSRRTGRRCEWISIVPDILNQYTHRNLIVLPPPGVPAEPETGGLPVSLRADSARFMEAVSAHPAVHRLIDRILSGQEHLFIHMYESIPEMTLDDRPRVSLLGPDKELARRLNNKAVQYRMLAGTVPVVDFRICESMADLLTTTEQLRPLWPDGIFVSRLYSAAGTASAITRCQEDILRKFGHLDEQYLISRYIPHLHDPTVLAVVANGDEVYIAGVADQRIEDGNRFVGSTYPSILPRQITARLREYTRRVGRLMGREGYRGIFGCDYLVDADMRVHFVEINARKQGTTLEFCYALEQILPPGSPSLPELEYHAVLEGRFPADTVEPDDTPPPVCWGTYNYKLRERHVTCGYIPQNIHERESFCRVARGELFKDYVILEHIGSRHLVMPGTFLARAVSVAREPDDVREGLDQARRMIELTIDNRNQMQECRPQ
ncbi:ATP-grasp domain-containing protein [Thermodesulfobacteriota bacterium B35]